MARPAGPPSARPRPTLGRTANPRAPGPRAPAKGEPGAEEKIRSSVARQDKPPFFSPATRAFVVARAREAMGFVLGLFGLLLMILLGSYNPADPSLNSIPAGSVRVFNLFGAPGAYVADLLIQSIGWASFVIALVPMFWGWRLGAQRSLGNPVFRTVLALWGVVLVAMALAGLSDPSTDPLAPMPGGSVGAVLLRGVGNLFGAESMVATVAAFGGGFVLFLAAGLSVAEWIRSFKALGSGTVKASRFVVRGARAGLGTLHRRGVEAAQAAAQTASGAVDDALLRREPGVPPRGRHLPSFDDVPRAASGAAQVQPAGLYAAPPEPEDAKPPRPIPVVAPRKAPEPESADTRPDHSRADHTRPDPRQATLPLGLEEEEGDGDGYELPPLDLLQSPPLGVRGEQVDESLLQRNAGQLEGVLGDFGVRGEVQKVHPGPVVTLYELEPAPGTKSSRVIGLADDIARSMSAVSVRVAVVPAQRHRHRTAQCPARNGAAARTDGLGQLRQERRQAGAGAGQGHRRPAGGRRSGALPPSAGRRHHRVGQVGRHQHDDPVAALPAAAGALPLHHDRPEDAGTVGL